MKATTKFVSGRFSSCFATLLWLLILAASAAAQESRGTITGTVTDTTGAVVPGATVTIINIATNTPSTTNTTDDGNYTVPFLQPGRYRVTVEASNFKRLVREDVEVNIGDKLGLDLALEAGSLSEVVTVTGENARLVQSETATVGQVIDRRRVSELPLADGNPITLTRLAAGVTQTTFTPDSSQPFSNTDQSSLSTNGAQGGNEFTLDGSPNTTEARPATGNRVAFVPPADAVQEFKVTTASFDAQQGHTAGASIDVAVRNGTNNFNGTLYEFVRNDVLSANNFFTNRTASLGLDEDGKARRAPRRYNRYGGTIGGPVFLPRIGSGGPGYYSGRDRTFFFFSYEGIRTNTPRPTTFTVPTLAERSGDFSALLAQGVTIFDPLTATQQGSRIVRTPFAGNIIPQSRIDPVARNFLQLFPLANQPGDRFGLNNFAGTITSVNDYYTVITRVDHTINERNKIFGRYSYGSRVEDDENFTGITNGVRATGFREERINNGGTIDYVLTATPTTIFNLKAGFQRFYNPETPLSVGDGFDPASLGFTDRTAAFFGGVLGVPRLNIPNFGIPGDNEIGGRTVDFVTSNIYSVQPTVTKIAGNHTLRFGYDFRAYRENSFPPADRAGRYRFSTDFTRLNDQTTTAAPIGQELAAFLLGLPSNSSIIELPATRANQNLYNGFFFQDDWKVRQNLTLNLGLRYEYEGTTTERFNRNIRTFDTTTTNPIEARVRANLQANPVSGIDPNTFRVTGGPVFVSDGNRSIYEPDKNNFQPRLGFAYQINPLTVVRGGLAVYAAPFTISGINQNGFSQTTAIEVAGNNGLPDPNNGGRRFVASLSDPFPGGIVQPSGASRGLATGIGQTIGSANLLLGEFDRRNQPLTIEEERKNPQSYRFELSLQRELPGNFLVEAAYIGSRGRDLTAYVDINAIPRALLSADAAQDAAVIANLDANIPNPFQRLEEARGSSFFFPSTIRRGQLLRPFPQYGSIFVQRYDGRSSYDSGQFRIEKRLTQGYTIQLNYTYSKFLEQFTLLNPIDEKYEKRLSGADTPHRVAASGIFEVPFGRGRRYLSNVGRLAEILIGGFQLNGIYIYQSGFPITIPNVGFRNISTLRSDIDSSTIGNPGAGSAGTTFDTTVFFDRPATRANVGSVIIRTLPTRLGSFRSQPFNNFDVSVIKNLNFSERYRLQLRAELLNAFNKPLFGIPDLNPRNAGSATTVGTFGAVADSQLNLPRELQLGVKFIF